jgi:KDO2-lipid IV(A) lauroyltransferase
MYYLVFAFFYLHALLPYRVLYGFADVAAFLLFHVVGYRKSVVLNNLAQAFPEKPEAERRAIARAFYRNFCDTWVETLKIMTLTRKEAARRIDFDLSILDKYGAGGRPIQAATGHMMNWEYTLVVTAAFQPIPLLPVYMPLTNKIMDRLMLHLRSRFGAIMIGAGRMSADMKPWIGKQYIIGLAADQSPLYGRQGYWVKFMNQPTPFIRGPWDRGCRMNHPTTFMHITKPRRGYYRFRMLPLEEAPANITPRQMVVRYARMLEENIRQNPEIYLWSHRRWKHAWQPEYARFWADTEPMPESQI